MEEELKRGTELVFSCYWGSYELVALAGQEPLPHPHPNGMICPPGGTYAESTIRFVL